jgi:rSAM/selenodomain-associated transferase 2
MKVELAVVIPTLDEEATIGSCLDSVGKHEGVEAVVVDGGSSDRTRERAREAGARVERGARGRGPQLNLGASASTADRLLFLHADCLLPADWLPALRTALDDERVSLASFRLHTVSATSEVPSAMYRLFLKVFDLRSHGLGLPYGDQAFGVRRQIFDTVGGFPEIPLMEDVAFARACRRQGRIRRLPLEIRTTARRFERRPLRTGLMFLTFPTLYRLGVEPQTLARWYGAVR